MTRAEARRELGVAGAASPREVERAFRRQAGVHHPDRGGEARAFLRVLEARELLREVPLSVPMAGRTRARRRRLARLRALRRLFRPSVVHSRRVV